MNIKEIERVVASVQHAVFKNANSLAAGAMRSRFRGSGLQFREHQVYAHGDDVRFIDWKVSARTSHIYLKTFEEDRNVEICVVIDVTSSSFYGSRGVSKLQMAFEITALLYLLAQETHDQVRVIVLCGGEKWDIPPKKGREGLILFISSMTKIGLLTDSGQVNLKKQHGLKQTPVNLIHAEIKRHLARKKEIVFLGDMENFIGDEKLISTFMDSHFHGMRLLSPLDTKALKFSFSSSRTGLIGLGSPQRQAVTLNRFPVITSDERYLELFLRRIR